MFIILYYHKFFVFATLACKADCFQRDCLKSSVILISSPHNCLNGAHAGFRLIHTKVPLFCFVRKKLLSNACIKTPPKATRYRTLLGGIFLCILNLQTPAKATRLLSVKQVLEHIKELFALGIGFFFPGVIQLFQQFFLFLG